MIEDIIIQRLHPVIRQEIEDQINEIRRMVAQRMMNPWVSAYEMADIIGMSHHTILYKRRIGELPYKAVAGGYYFNLDDIYENAGAYNFRSPGKIRDRIARWRENRVKQIAG